MLTWFKSIFGITPKREEAIAANVTSTPLVLEDPVVEAPKPKKKAAPKPKKTTKVESIDLDSLSKTQLLAEAKKRGIKANASLKKEEILDRIRSA